MKFSIKKFFATKKNFFLILSSAILFILVFILDLAFFTATSIPTNIYWTRECFVVVAALLLGIVVYRRQYEHEKNIIYKLKTFFFSILGLFVAVVVPKLIFRSDFYLFSQEYVRFLDLFLENVKTTFLAVFVTLFLIINLFWLRDLIFYKSKKGTHRLFKLAFFLLAISIAYGHYSRKIVKTDWAFQGRNPAEWIIYGLLLGVMVLLSFRTSWVNYLNKRQKILAFWGGAIMIPGGVYFFNSGALQSILQYSFTLGTFDSFVAYFLAIYIVVGETSLLLHLPTASIFDKRMKEISSLQNLSRMISSVLDYNEVISNITALTKDVLMADACWLEMTRENGSLQVVSSHNLSKSEIQNMPLSKEEGVSGWICKTRKSILVNEVAKDTRTNYIRKFNKNIESLLGVPLISKNQVIGILYATKNEIFGFDQDDREMLQAFANQATVAIENARLVEESLEKERLEQELRVAHDTQVKLLPKEMPSVAGLEIDAFCITANEVGGDYYDFIRLNENKLGVVIADVSGKGLSAAFYMAELKGIVNSFARLYYSPKIFLQKVNETLFENVDRKTFVSMIYAIFDTKKQKTTFCRAGHFPPIYCNHKDNRISVLQSKGIGVALDAGKIFNQTLEEFEIKWNDQDLFLFFTDGLTEARNYQNEEYGEERVLRLVEETRNQSVENMRKTIIEDVSSFIGAADRHDDLSVVSMKIVQ